MTQTMNDYMTEMTNSLIEEAIMHAEEIGRSIPDPEFAPDPAFEGMAFEGIRIAIEDHELEAFYAREYARDCL